MEDTKVFVGDFGKGQRQISTQNHRKQHIYNKRNGKYPREKKKIILLRSPEKMIVRWYSAPTPLLREAPDAIKLQKLKLLTDIVHTVTRAVLPGSLLEDVVIDKKRRPSGRSACAAASRKRQWILGLVITGPETYLRREGESKMEACCRTRLLNSSQSTLSRLEGVEPVDEEACDDEPLGGEAGCGRGRS